MSELIGEVEKNQKEQIRVSIENYRNYEFVDCRVYWNDNGTWRPSRKGISLNNENIDEVLELLKKASKAMEGR